MRWNWQQTDWPDFTFKDTALEAFEVAFLQQSGVIIGAFRHLGEDDKDRLKVDLISTEALKTSEIEGEIPAIWPCYQHLRLFIFQVIILDLRLKFEGVFKTSDSSIILFSCAKYNQVRLQESWNDPFLAFKPVTRARRADE